MDKFYREASWFIEETRTGFIIRVVTWLILYELLRQWWGIAILKEITALFVSLFVSKFIILIVCGAIIYIAQSLNKKQSPNR